MLGFKEPPIGNGMWAIEWSRDQWRHVTLKGQTRDPNTLRAQYLENYLSYRLQIWCAALYRKCWAGAQIIFPESGCGLGHVTPTIFGIRSNISPKLLELQTPYLVGGFVLGMPSRRTNNFPESGRGLGHVTYTIFGSTVGYLSDSLASCRNSFTCRFRKNALCAVPYIHCVQKKTPTHISMCDV